MGKLNDDLDRGYVFGLIPTPPNDHGQPACTLLEGGANKRKPSKGKPPKDSAPSLEIDVGWVAEHARQVYKLLWHALPKRRVLHKGRIILDFLPL